MAAIPRIVTADSTGNVSRLVRSAIELLELSVVQVDSPNATNAIDVVNGAALVVAPFDVDTEMKGVEFAMRVKRASPDTSVVILGEHGDPEELYEEDPLESPFVYLMRPVDIHQFLRVMVAGIENHESMVRALTAPVEKAGPRTTGDMGPVPAMDLDKAQPILDALLQDLGAMAIILATRTGETLLERGAFGYIDRDQLANAIMPTMITNIDVKDLVGGEISSIQFYDGDDYDIFVLTVGLHHFLCVMFEGQQGSRQFGLVNRFGRKSVQDLIGILGANAFLLQKPVAKAPEPPRRVPDKRKTQEAEPVVLERASFREEEEEEEEIEIAEREHLQLEPIAELDLDGLFGGDMAMDEDLFSLESVEAIAKEQEEKERKGTLDWDQAKELGILEQ